MNYTYSICKLSEKFYKAYPQNKYPEILAKESRAYTCLLIETKYDYYICVPFRSNISHNNGFIFKNTERSKTHRSGLDYSKIVIFKNEIYLGASAVIDRDEYNRTKKYIDKIVNQVISYIDGYINHHSLTHILNKNEYNRHYRYSTLKYFHDILKIKTH